MSHKPKNIIKVLGITQRQLNLGFEKGHFPISKRGKSYDYTDESVCQLKLFFDLIGSGLTKSKASKIAFHVHIFSVLKHFIDKPLKERASAPDRYIVINKKLDGCEISIIHDQDELLDLYSKTPGFIIMYNLTKAILAVRIGLYRAEREDKERRLGRAKTP